MYDLIVGCPVYKREWIMPWWFHYAKAATERVGSAPYYLFVGDPQDTTCDLIRALLAKHKQPGEIVEHKQKELDGQRHWNPTRYQQMAEIRNKLLERVNALQPTFFLSLDSDILINPKALEGAIEMLGPYDAVGAKTYLSKGVNCSNYAMLGNGRGLHRPDSGRQKKVDVLMAIKLMGKLAYQIPYVSEDRGEDIGWSKNCTEHGLRLGWDGRYPSKHVMQPNALKEVDLRCGY